MKKQIEMNWLIKNTNFCTGLNYIEYFLILSSTITGCISISSFSSLVGILIRITSSARELKTCAIIVGIKKKYVNH